MCTTCYAQGLRKRLRKMDITIALLFILGLSGGVYLTLIGMGVNLPPQKWRSIEEIAWAGRIVIFLSLLLLPTFFGASLHQVHDWLEDIWTTGGGKGTG